MPRIKPDSHYGMYINGEFVEASDKKIMEVYCPANGELLSTIPQATKEDVDFAVKSAQEAFLSFKKTSAGERANLLNAIAQRIEDNLERLAMIETLDNGKPIRETKNADIPLGADHFRYFAGVIRGESGSVDMLDENTLSMILQEPIGVVGQIVPWNFPFLMAAWKLAPALAAGCSVVIKPSSYTSLSLLELMKIIGDIVPNGVINVITGSGSKAGDYILHHPGFDKLAFTGSTEVGRKVAIAAAEKLIPSTLELGGKSANIVFPDAKWDMAIEGVQAGILFNQGQVCSAGSRLFLHEDIYEDFLKDLSKAFSKVKVGLPWEEDTQMGATVYEEQIKKVLRYVEIGQNEGATLLQGGKRITDRDLDKGFFVEPTILSDVNNKMRVAQEEIFGPVLVVIPFKSEEEVIAMANESSYGLAGGVWTRDINRAIRVGRGIRTGRLWVNTYNTFPAGAPFGGYKESGIGRETHKSILNHYTQSKNLLFNLSEKPSGMY